MAQLVSLNLVKQVLRIAEYGPDNELLANEDDAIITSFILTAQDAIIRYLKSGADPDWTEDTAPPAVRTAIIMAVQALYDPGQMDLLAGLGAPDPKNPLVALLCMLRRPTLA